MALLFLVFVIPAFIGAIAGIALVVGVGLAAVVGVGLALGLAVSLVVLLAPYLLLLGIAIFLIKSAIDSRREGHVFGSRATIQNHSKYQQGVDLRPPRKAGEMKPFEVLRSLNPGESAVFEEWGFRSGRFVSEITPFRVDLCETGIEREEILERFRLHWLLRRVQDAVRSWKKAGHALSAFDYWINESGEFEVFHQTDLSKAEWLRSQTKGQSSLIYLPRSSVASYCYRMDRLIHVPGVSVLSDPMRPATIEKQFREHWFRRIRGEWERAWEHSGNLAQDFKFCELRGQGALLLARRTSI